MEVLDLTLPLDESTPIYRDSLGYSDPPTKLARWIDVGETPAETTRRRASPFRVTRLEIGLHTGTHLDAPAHFAPGAAALDALPPAALVGTAVVVDLSGTPGIAYADDLLPSREAASRPGTIPLLLLAAGSRLSPGAVDELIAWSRPLLCVSGSIDGDDLDCPATARLLRAGLFLAVDLAASASEVRDGDLLVVAPLPLRGVEGAPARVLALRPTLEPPPPP